MMKKIPVFVLGLALGVAVTFGVTHYRFGPIGAQAQAGAETFNQLRLFGDVFERVLNDYVEEPNEERADRERPQRHAHLARPALSLSGPGRF
jgi:carboxyl-terminal processing protease